MHAVLLPAPGLVGLLVAGCGVVVRKPSFESHAAEAADAHCECLIVP